MERAAAGASLVAVPGQTAAAEGRPAAPWLGSTIRRSVPQAFAESAGARLGLGSSGFERPLIFPEPRQLELRGAPFILTPECVIVLPQAASQSELALARFLTQELSDRYDLQVRQERRENLPSSGKFILMGTVGNPLLRDFCRQNQVTPQSPGPEGYVLQARPGAVVVAGSDERGAFYGLQSLRQMISQQEGGLEVPGAQVRDWPDKPFRGFKLYVPGQTSIPFFRRFVREVLALYKFNTLMIEMNGCMRLDRHPEVNAGAMAYARDTNYSRRNYPPGSLHRREQNSSHQDCGEGGLLEKDEVAGLVHWCEAHHLEVVPEIPSFTHSFYLLARHRDLTDVPGDKWPDTYCPSEPRSYQLLFEVLDEYIEVMKPRLIHTGHDEWFAPFGLCPRCRGKEPGELLGRDLLKTHDHLAGRNIRMAIWGDYLLETVRGAGLQKRHAPDGWAYSSPGGMTPRQVKDLVPKDILLFNWFWDWDDHGAAAEAQLDAWGFRQIYGNMEPDITNYAERIKRPSILGGAPSSWSASTESNLSKDLTFSTLGCANLLWARRPLELPALARLTQASYPWLRPRLRGTALPSESGDPIITVDITSSYNLPGLETTFGIDLRGLEAGPREAGPRRFQLPAARGAAVVGAQGGTPNPLPRELTLKLGQDASSLLFLHACAQPATNKEAYRLIWDMADSADLLGWYEVVYEDGLPEVIPIRYGVNILEWNWAPSETSRKGCYDAAALVCGKASGAPITFFAFEWANPRLGKVITEVRLKGSTGFRGAVPGFEDAFGAVMPSNAVILKALSYVQSRCGGTSP